MNCNTQVAMLAGTNAGIVAETLRNLMEAEEEVVVKFGKTWCRCSMKTITVFCPFLSIDQASYAIKALKRRGIICCMKMEVKKFDHTNWFAFTEYGMRIMKRGDMIGQKNETESNQQAP